MAAVDMKALLEAGVHFGHRTQKWDPRMRPYIFTERNGIHIIDLQQTVKALEDAYKLVRDMVADGKNVLFVGTKRQAVETIEAEAQRAEMPYVTVRWLGGMLTNWQTMRQRIGELEKLERMAEEPQSAETQPSMRLTKRELLGNTRTVEKLEERFGGIREMTRPPDLLFVVDVKKEETAVKEANILGIPVLALVDTNCDPSVIDHVIPSNDDAIRAIKLMVSYIADAAVEGRSLRQDKQEVGEAKKVSKTSRKRTTAEAGAEAPVVEELTDADLLGAATLAKVAEDKAKEEAEAVAKAAKEAKKAETAAAEPAAAKAEKKPAKKVAAKKTEKKRKPKSKIRKSDLEGEGEEAA
ncbi:MAG: 30S ribosomal protein S2 [Anaerolineales bacterium]